MGGQMGGAQGGQQQNTGGQLPPGFSQPYGGGGPVTTRGGVTGPGVDSPRDPGNDPVGNPPPGGFREPIYEPNDYPGQPGGPGGTGGGPGGAGTQSGAPAWTNANEPWYVPGVEVKAPWASDLPPQYNPVNWGPSYTPWAPGGMPPWGANTGGGWYDSPSMQQPPPGQGLPPWMGGPPPGQTPPGTGGPLTQRPGGPGMQTQGPNQIGPIGGDFGPPYGPGQGPGGPGPFPPGMGGPGGPPTQPNVQPPVSVYDTYNSGKQMMDETLDQAIGGSVASAGFGGNRYGTAAANAVGRVGADAAAELNNQFTNMLYNQGNQDLNRQLQATGMGLQNQLAMEQLKAGNLNQGLDRLLRGADIGMQQGQMNESQIAQRLQMLLGAGQQETGRQDQWDMAAWQDFENNKWAPLDRLAPFVGGVPSQSQEPIVSQSAGSPGFADYAAIAAPIIAAAMMSDETQKTNIQDTGLKVGPLAVKTWDWKRDGKSAVGFIAQEVEAVYPDAVFEVPAGTKMIDTARLVAGLQMGAR